MPASLACQGSSSSSLLPALLAASTPANSVVKASSDTTPTAQKKRRVLTHAVVCRKALNLASRAASFVGLFFKGCGVGLHVWNPCVLKSVPYKDKYMIGKGLFQHSIPDYSGLSYLIRNCLFIGHLINVPSVSRLTVFSFK